MIFHGLNTLECRSGKNIIISVTQVFVCLGLMHCFCKELLSLAQKPVLRTIALAVF